MRSKRQHTNVVIPVRFLDFNKMEQKQSPHIDYNPNGRIPTLVDRNNNDFPVWESNAMMPRTSPVSWVRRQKRKLRSFSGCSFKPVDRVGDTKAEYCKMPSANVICI